MLGIAGSADRMELFDATSQVIESAAADTPLVVVVDDLHHADAASAALLRYVADRIVALPVLVLATQRPATADRHEVIAELDLLGRKADTIELKGLDVADVAGLVPDGLSPSRVHAATGGNPLFVREVARLPAVDIEAIDGSLRDVVRRRLADTRFDDRRCGVGTRRAGAGCLC